ncbi:AMP-dependent synthetase/ligase [Sphingobacterium sp. Mn56C]|uniref:AMP-dependent synthetase/ligase n=1 Tax=Sphingobacterium sp. Mn56C TaxID=3395261 RepID=UPI003BC96EE1
MNNKPTRVFDLAPHQLAHFPTLPMFGNKIGGQWQLTSSKDFIDQIDIISRGLIALGVKPYDKVGLVSENRVEWNMLDFAIQQVGAVVVAIYPNISDSDYKYIFNHAEIKIAVVSSQQLYERITNLRPAIPQLETVFMLDNHATYPNWKQIHSQAAAIAQDLLIHLRSTILPEDLATLIYTSGTTGNPKGVMLTHKNLLADVMSSTYSFPVQAYQRALSFLPACHAYERVFHYVYMYMGLTIYFAQSMDTIGLDMKEVKPHIFSAVPRVLEKVYDKIINTGKDLTGIKRRLFFWAIALGERYSLENRSQAYNMQLYLARKLIFSKWHAALGGEVVGIASGSAALQERLLRVYLAAGIPIFEGYGLTEASPCLSVNDLKRGITLGTVGVPLLNITIKLADDGEILAKGDNIMKGYYKNPEATAEVIKDGWLHTGDIGEWVNGKFLKIIDRKKEMFKTSGGKYVVPQAIESKMVESPFIEQFMVIGEGQKFPAALVVPSYSNLFEWAKINDIELSKRSREAFMRSAKVHEMIKSEILHINSKFGQWEQIKKFAIIPNEFTIEGGELTPTLKMKRKKIIEKYFKNYNEIYNA